MLNLFEEKMFRGINGSYDDSKYPHITWFTTNPNYARTYADSDSNVHEYDVNVGNVFSFGTNAMGTELSSKELTRRITKGIMDSFNKGAISKEQGQQLVNTLRKFSQENNQHMDLYKWYSNYPVISQILKSAGYDSIGGYEDSSMSSATFGVFDKNNFRKL